MKNIIFSIITTSLLTVSTSTADNNLIITEFMPSPNGYDSDREWFEIYNADNEAVNLNGIEFHSNGTQHFKVTLDRFVESGDRFVFGVSDDPILNGGIDVDYVYNYRHFSLAKVADEIKIILDGEFIDEVYYQDALESKSFFLPHYQLDNSDMTNWRVSSLPSNRYGDGGFGTPGDLNEDVLEVVIKSAPQSVKRGDIVKFDLDVYNPTDHNVWFDAWMYATRHDMSYLPMVRFDNAIDRDKSVQKTITLHVPLNIATGEYVISTEFGIFEDSTFWHDSFNLTVE